jgi:hypothetical protein
MKKSIQTMLAAVVSLAISLSCAVVSTFVPTPTPIPPTSTATPLPTPTATPIIYNAAVNVVDENGKPVSNAKISQDETIELTDNQGVWQKSSQSPNLSFNVWAQGYLSQEHSSTMQAGANNIQIQLSPDPFGLKPADLEKEGYKLVFVEDFQDGKEGFSELQGDWKVVDDIDNAGNKVIQVDQREISDMAEAIYKPDNNLESFSVQYKFRWLELTPFTGSEWQSMGFSFWNRYAIDMYAVNNGWLQILDFSTDPWQFPVQSKNYFKVGTWYTIGIVVDGEEISLYVNERLLKKYKELQKGDTTSGFSLYALQHALGQFDDIVVKIK